MENNVVPMTKEEAEKAATTPVAPKATRKLTEEQKKAFKEREAKKKEEKKAAASELIDLLKKDKKWDGLKDNIKQFLLNTANPASSIHTSPVFSLLFEKDGPAKVGNKITLAEAMQRTLKGQGVLNAYVKVWKEKGIVVEYNPDTKDPLKSTFELKALPQA